MYTLREKQVHAYFNLSKGIEFFKGFISYKTLKCVRGVRLGNHTAFFVHHVLGPNILSVLICRSINYNTNVKKKLFFFYNSFQMYAFFIGLNCCLLYVYFITLLFLYICFLL